MQITALVSVVALLGAVVEAHGSPRDHRALAQAHAARAAKNVEGSVHRSKRDPNLYIRTDKGGRQCKVRPSKSDSAPATLAATPSAFNPGQQLVADTTVAANPQETTGAQGEVPPPAQDSASAPAADSSAPSAEPTAATSSAAPPAATGGSTGSPLRCKAGISSGNMLEKFGSRICWWHDWGSTGFEKNPSDLTYIPTLWGDGHKGDRNIGANDQTDAKRRYEFEQYVNGVLYNGQPVPKYVAGFNEPDCETQYSSDIKTESAKNTWDQLIKPLGERGAQLISPAPCHQESEEWLQEFNKLKVKWDITNVHIYKKDAASAMAVVNLMWERYQKPIIITELGCVDDKKDFAFIEDRGVVYNFIKELIPQLEAHPHVIGYAFSEGDLGAVWKIMDGDDLSETAKVYLQAIPPN